VTSAPLVLLQDLALDAARELPPARAAALEAWAWELLERAVEVARDGRLVSAGNLFEARLVQRQTLQRLHDLTVDLPEVLLVPGELDPLGPASPYDQAWITLRGLPGWGDGVRIVPALADAAAQIGVKLDPLLEGRTGWPRLAVVHRGAPSWEPVPGSLEAGSAAPAPAGAPEGISAELLQAIRTSLHAAGEAPALALLEELIAEVES
jgi:hypothetical protein